MACSDTFYIARDINLVDLLSLAATIGIGIYLAVHIEKRRTDKRREKDIVIDYMEEICQGIRELKNMTESRSFELVTSVQSLKDVRMSFTRLCEMLLFCELSVKKMRLLNFAGKLRDINRLMTNTPIGMTISEEHNVVENGRMRISDKNAVILNRLLHELLTDIRFIQLEVNTL